MRVTNNMMTNNLLRNLSNASGKMIDIQNRLSTGSRINKPSDDPVGVETAMRLKSTLSSMQQWKKNVSEGMAYIQSTEGVLDGMTSMMHRIKELAVQGANGATTPDDKLKVQNEVDQLIKQFEMSANSQFNGRYIFSGTRSDQEALAGSVAWNGSAYELSWGGNSNPVNIEVGPGLLVDISVNGENLYGIDPPGPGSPKTSALLTTLYRLSDALKNNDYEEINAVLGKNGDSSDPHTLTEITNTLLSVRSDLGARANRLENMENQLATNIINVQQNLSSVADVDMAEAIIEFKSIQNIYQAALSVGAQIIQPSLVDFIR